MNVGFAIYETLRRLLILGVVVAFVSFLLSPEERPLDLENSMVLNESRAPAGQTAAAGSDRQETVPRRAADNTAI